MEVENQILISRVNNSTLIKNFFMAFTQQPVAGTYGKCTLIQNSIRYQIIDVNTTLTVAVGMLYPEIKIKLLTDHISSHGSRSRVECLGCENH